MKAFGDGPDISPSSLVKGFPWASLGAAIVVHVGGSNGAISMTIAEAHHNIKLIVEDRLNVIEAAREAKIPRGLENRIEFSAHDFFTETTPGCWYLPFPLHIP